MLCADLSCVLLSCQRAVIMCVSTVRLSCVHGETADVGTSDGTIWLSQSTGLPLKVENVMTTDADKRHLSILYSYTNIRAPLVN
jgi:hypothetical protein